MSGSLIVDSWLADHVAAGGNVGRGSLFVEHKAHIKAQQYDEIGTAYDDFQPGNGTSYLMVLHDLVRPQAQALYDRWDRPGEPDSSTVTNGRLHGAPQHVDECRTDAESMGMSARAGGELLVALPANFGGRAYVVSLVPPYHPTYVMDHLHCNPPDAVWLAIYLTYFVRSVGKIRADREQAS